MHFSIGLRTAALLAALPASLAAQYHLSVSYDSVYDNYDSSVNTVACSSKLRSMGFDTLGSIPTFPNIGGAMLVSKSGSDNCGTCWKLEYNNRTVAVLVIDSTDDGFNISKDAYIKLDSMSTGRLEASATEVSVSDCGL
ncbi:uncharacterized protein FIBRA_04490 [Fibroporia radiculosa]|uniref:Cerato-platanin n=1 Tax=Fibroporia radiculosa TaxID=599839 RepID=J4HWJ9_9APHY|nr:uncharacterized protein FIBRA_04490 [Fibroporia radiculosa]CCM02392.1 predicted protein [Fibroporia radiculosa]